MFQVRFDPGDVEDGACVVGVFVEQTDVNVPGVQRKEADRVGDKGCVHVVA